MFRFTPFFLAIALVGLSACDQDKKKANRSAPPAPSVITQVVKTRAVSAAIDYVGRIEASQRVEIRSRVEGMLLEIPFKEGALVKAGDPLFSIEPAEFEADHAIAQAGVARAKAEVVEASANLERYKVLLKRNVTSQAKFDQANAKAATARADLAAKTAALRKAQLDLGYTKITAPISGRIGRVNVDAGNIVGPDSGVLVTIVKINPIKAVFSIAERDYLNYTESLKKGHEDKLIPRIRLANEQLYAHDGTFDMIDNEVDPKTGTISVRASFPNPDRLLVPGQYVAVILTSKKPEHRIVVPQVAVQENQAGPFVLIVNKQNRVEARPIKTGQRVGPDIVALEGLKTGETIIIDGIQKVRPGGKVNTRLASAHKPHPTKR